jgi:hypothetical protein
MDSCASKTSPETTEASMCKHLVPLVAGVQKPHRGLPHLWRVVGP